MKILPKQNDNSIDCKNKSSIFDNQGFLSISCLTRLLNVPEKTIRHWIYRREIPFYKIGRHIRFDPKDIQQWISDRRQTYEC